MKLFEKGVIESLTLKNRVIMAPMNVGACTALKRDLPDFSSCKTDINSMLVKTYDENIVEEKLLFSENKH